MSVNIQIWSPTTEHIRTHPQWNELMSPENCVALSTSKLPHTGPVWLPLKWGQETWAWFWVLGSRTESYHTADSRECSKPLLPLHGPRECQEMSAKRCPQTPLRRLNLTSRINPHLTKEGVLQMSLQTNGCRTEDATRCSLQDRVSW